MCGRYTLSTPADVLAAEFGLTDIAADFLPHFNLAPTQPVAVVPNRDERRLELYRWGLIPHWSRDAAGAARRINARVETVMEKASFREAFERRRCLVLADGFYEWLTDGKRKRPMYFQPAGRGPVAFAGLWEVWRAPDGTRVPSCTILTGAADAVVAPIHDRMPIILPPAAYAAWLDPAPRPAIELADLLAGAASTPLTVYEVSPLVNSVANDRPECLEPARDLFS